MKIIMLLKKPTNIITSNIGFIKHIEWIKKSINLFIKKWDLPKNNMNKINKNYLSNNSRSQSAQNFGKCLKKWKKCKNKGINLGK